jgi:hypothetical protein
MRVSPFVHALRTPLVHWMCISLQEPAQANEVRDTSGGRRQVQVRQRRQVQEPLSEGHATPCEVSPSSLHSFLRKSPPPPHTHTDTHTHTHTHRLHGQLQRCDSPTCIGYARERAHAVLHADPCKSTLGFAGRQFAGRRKSPVAQTTSARSHRRPKRTACRPRPRTSTTQHVGRL